MTNDILRLSDALTRDTERAEFRSKLNSDLTRDSEKIRESLSRSGEYRISTSKGDVIIRKKSA